MKPTVDQDRERVIRERTMRGVPGLPGVAVAAVLRRVALGFGVTPEALRGRCRQMGVVWPRQVAHWILYQMGYSLPVLGRALGRDHSGVLYNVRVVESYRDVYPEVRLDTNRLLELCMAEIEPERNQNENTNE
ncbi:MAG TPA: helix-turn-helix domain-containing protein [Kiritimatiellia bacterium]|nr:helix-turn-helix domain-containing protein [Kiritimatiellia bacterium]